MLPRHRASRAAVELIKRFEGYRERAVQLPDGRWMIGYGHVETARQGAQVSQADAETLLIYDLLGIAKALNAQVFAPLTQNQFDALASFAFNLGVDNFSRSGVLRRLNEGSPILAACAMELWRKAEVGGEKIVVDALVRRRAAEKALFLTPQDGDWALAPSHLLIPAVDATAFDLIPLTAPARVSASLDGEKVVAVREIAPTPVPPEEDDAEGGGPVKAAAEAVTARLSTLFLDTDSPPARDFPRFSLEASHPDADDDVEPSDDDEAESDRQDEASRGPDLFGYEAADHLEHSDDDDRPPIPQRRGDAVALQDIDGLVVNAIPQPPEGGLATPVGLGVLGLIFFGGGAIWATNGRAPVEGDWIGPQGVGLGVGLIGAFFVAIAVYLLLRRLARASERAATLHE